MELLALEDHYELIEKQLEHLTLTEQVKLSEYRQKEHLSPQDPEWDFSRQECDHKVEFLLPRFFWGSFIISLYAVYETSVIEIANLLQKNQKQEIGINDLKGDFLERAKKYYKSILKFELCSDAETWERIRMLSVVRHAIAHANGRVDMINDNTNRKIKTWKKKDVGLNIDFNYLIIDSKFANDTYKIINLSLIDMVNRYKEWDTNNKSV
jgi:hypothetical protein